MTQVLEWSLNLWRGKKLDEEHRWTALSEGDEGCEWRNQNKKPELGRGRELT